MKIDIKLIFVIIIIVIVVISIFNNLPNKKDKPYYDINEIEPKLKNIDKLKYDILDEIIVLNNDSDKWMDWPEKTLYNHEHNWKVYPLNVFGTWIENNCKKCQSLTQFLKSIPNLKLAILSKMSGGTILTPHQGWWKLSNYSIRCHYGLIIPENCFVNVLDNNVWNKKYHKQFEWLIFDDSKTHNAENLSDTDRIILLLDVERPTNIQIGKSEVEDTKELTEIVDIARSIKY